MTTTMTTEPNTIASVYDKLRAYNGNNTFILSLRIGLLKYGRLTEKQLPHAMKFFEQQKEEVKLVSLEIVEVRQYPVYILQTPQLITIKGQFFVKQLCEEKLLLGDVISYAWEVSEVTGLTEKAIRVKAKIADSKHNLNFCRACCRSLTDKFSIATGMGKVCSGKYGLPYVTDLSQVEEYKISLDKKIEEIGQKEFWLPKSKIEYTDLQNLLNELEKAQQSIREEEVSKHDKNINATDLVSIVCDTLMDKAIPFSVLSDEDSWLVTFKSDELIKDNFNTCSKLFIDEYNKGKDVCLSLISNNTISFNQSNLINEK
jgi:hypothetical protein